MRGNVKLHVPRAVNPVTRDHDKGGEIQMNKVDTAVSSFEAGFSCTQAVLSTYGEDFGLTRDVALRVAAAFGGGMGRMGKMCGAVTGAFMVLGLRFGSTDQEDSDAREKTYELVRDFTRRFREEHGSIICNDLLGCDISTPDGREEASRKGLFGTLCPKLVKSAAEKLEAIL